MHRSAVERRPHFHLAIAFSLACIANVLPQCLSAADYNSSSSGLNGAPILFPARLHVAPEHPASFSVFVRTPDGTLRAPADGSEIELTIEDESIARFVGADRIEAVRSGSTRLIARCGTQTTSADVVVATGDDAAPRFPIEVAAVLGKAGCNLGTCHGNLHGKGGFRLSLRGDNPRFDFESITQDSASRRINWIDPAQSLLLRKPSGQVAHRGGVRLPVDDEAYDIVLRWIDAGARWDAESTVPPKSENSIRVESLTVWPEDAWIDPATREVPLVVVAEFADGTRRDVTRWARFEANVLEGVEISELGRVAVDRPLDLSVSATFLDARGESRLVFLERGEAMEPAIAHTAGKIDQLINERLRQMRIDPLPAAPPTTFLRRLFLSVAGRLPRPAEVDAFLNDQGPQRKRRWVERVLADPGYADMWALHWSDLLRNEQKVMSSEGARRWNRWLAAQFRSDQPLDAIARELVSSVGSTYENPPASFHRTHRSPDVAAEAVGQVFLGVRIACAKCHNHPFDVWKQDDYYGLAAYFTTLNRKAIENKPKDKLDKHIITGDELISLTERTPQIRHPGLAEEVPPKPLDRPGFVTDPPVEEPLVALADWLTRDNRHFARNMANRIWFHVMGRGIVDPPDDFRGSNPPSNPQLLQWLTDRLIASGYSTRTVMRDILLSDAFARQSVSQEGDPQSLDAAPVFAGYPLRRMSAEVLLDAVSDAIGVASQLEAADDSYTSGRAVTFADVPNDGFLRAFGKPDRLLSCECERSDDASLSQFLLLMNGDDVRRKLQQHPNRIDSLWQQHAKADAFVRDLYIAVLSRLPTSRERKAMATYLRQADDRRTASEDVLWALINSTEFPWIR